MLKNLTHQAASTDWLWGDGDVGIDIDDGAREFEQAIDNVKVENLVPQELKDKLAELSKAKVNRRDLEDLKAEINKTHLKFNLQETLRKIDEFKSDPKVQDVKPYLESVTKELKDLERFVKVIEEQKEVLLPSLDKVEGLLTIDNKDLHVSWAAISSQWKRMALLNPRMIPVLHERVKGHLGRMLFKVPNAIFNGKELHVSARPFSEALESFRVRPPCFSG